MVAKIKFYCVIILVGSMSGMLLGGCAAMTNDLVEQGGVTVVTVPVNNVRYLYPRVTQKGTTIAVAGTVSLDDSSEYREMASHMDITILDQYDEPNFIAFAPYRRASPHGPSQQASFTVSAKLLVPENSRVIMRHHEGSMSCHHGSAPEAANFRCGDN